MSKPLGDLDSLENALKALVPAGKMHRDQLMYRAGQAAAGRGGWFWPFATFAMTVLAACFAVRPQPVPSERVVIVHAKEPAPSVAVAKTPDLPVAGPLVPLETWTVSTQHQPMDYLQLKQQALRWGVENLPLPMPPQVHVGEPQTLQSLMNDLSSAKSGYPNSP